MTLVFLCSLQHDWVGALGSLKGAGFSEVHQKAAPLFGEAPAECSSQCGGSWECGAFIRDRYFQRLGTGSGLARKRLGPQLYWLASKPADSEVRNEEACVFRLRRVGAFFGPHWMVSQQPVVAHCGAAC